MKQIKFLLILFTFLGEGVTLLAQPYQQSLAAYELGVIYLKVADTSNVQIVFPAPPGSGDDPFYRTFQAFGVTEVGKPFEALGTARLDRTYKVHFSESGSVQDFIVKMQSFSFIEYAEQVPEKQTSVTFPDDPSVPNGSYQLDLIRAYDAFDLHQGGNAIVAIVDDAVQVSHEDLAGNIAVGRDVADLDDDPNPPFSGNNAANANRFSHGTHVAGIAGAVTDNGIGVASIGWNNQLMAIKTVRDDAANTRIITHGFEGVAWAAANGADVINLSWGGAGFAQAEYDVIVAAQQAGSIIVASAGNNSTAQPSYPAAYGSSTTGMAWELADGNLVIAVASIDADGDVSDWGQGPFGPLGSNFGQWVDISSYGTAIFSTIAGSAGGAAVNNLYGNNTGTSMAAPLVAGLLGLMVSYNLNASDGEIINCLLGTANDDIYGPAHPNNVPGTLGSGRIDAFAALRCLAVDCDDDPIAIITPTSHFICQGGSVQLAANTGIGYLWSTGATTQLITVNQAGTYSVTVTFAGPCTSVATIEIENAITEASIIVQENSNIPNDGIICGTDFLFLTAFWGQTYQWSAFGATTQSVGPINAGINLPFTWNYSVTVTGVGGCPGVTDVVNGTAVWLDPPTASVDLQENSQTPNDGIICNGASANLTASGGVSYQWSNGATTALITVSPAVTTTFFVTVTDGSGCPDVAQIVVQVVECAFTCPCTAANTLTIDATAAGSLYSVLEAQFNYDQNNDGVLNLLDHNGCIAIDGRLIIDQNLTITDCPSMLMQPCSEIVVQGQRSLTMTQNTILGCEQMWRGITVEALGRLVFNRNVIQDAQHAITANGSFLSWPPPGGNTTTIIDVQRNRFIRNHIGVFVPGPSGSNLTQTPFSRNDFIGNGANPLLPPCDQGLANWNADNGYAGVVSQGVTFTVGAAGDQGITNTFSRLRNGVIGENCWLQVHHASFTDLVGEWVNEGQAPSFASSFGIGVLANAGFSTVNSSNFNNCGHGIYSRGGFLTAQQNDMPSVRRGIEISNPFGCNLSENLDIVYRNRGIVARDLQTSSLSQWLQYVINKNVVRNFDQTVVEGDMAIEVRNGNQPDLINARMSENEIFLNVAERGIFIQGVGRWTIDRNLIQYQPFNNAAPSGLGIGLNASARNYLYDNTVLDNSNNATSRGFNIANSAQNVFCCNETDGSRFGFRFFGACGSTTFRTSNMSAHERALEISQSGIMGEQGIFVPLLGIFVNNRNYFNAGSGEALHFGTTNAVVQASRFHVLSENTPDWPEVVTTQPGVTDPWFFDNGVFDYTCSVCEVPPLVPDVRGKDIEDADRTLAGDGFSDGTPGLNTLQWEATRNLYERMEMYPELHGLDVRVDNYYTNCGAGPVGDFYEADKLVNDLSWISASYEAAIAIDFENVVDAAASYEAKLAELEQALTLEDSLAIYAQAAQILSDASGNVSNLVQSLKLVNDDRSTRAQSAITTIQALPEDDQLMENRKDVLEIYAATIGQDNLNLSPTQAGIIKEIAYQCPEEGGSAVYLAQAIYQLIATEGFDDDVLCSTGQRSAGSKSFAGFGVEIIPNPASDEVAIVLPQNAQEGEIQITLLSISGQAVIDRKFSNTQGIIHLQLMNVPDGIYFCQVQAAGVGTSTHKLVIKH